MIKIPEDYPASHRHGPALGQPLKTPIDAADRTPVGAQIVAGRRREKNEKELEIAREERIEVTTNYDRGLAESLARLVETRNRLVVEDPEGAPAKFEAAFQAETKPLLETAPPKARTALRRHLTQYRDRALARLTPRAEEAKQQRRKQTLAAAGQAVADAAALDPDPAALQEKIGAHAAHLRGLVKDGLMPAEEGLARLKADLASAHESLLRSLSEQDPEQAYRLLGQGFGAGHLEGEKRQRLATILHNRLTEHKHTQQRAQEQARIERALARQQTLSRLKETGNMDDPDLPLVTDPAAAADLTPTQQAELRAEAGRALLEGTLRRRLRHAGRDEIPALLDDLTRTGLARPDTPSAEAEAEAESDPGADPSIAGTEAARSAGADTGADPAGRSQPVPSRAEAAVLAETLLAEREYDLAEDPAGFVQEQPAVQEALAALLAPVQEDDPIQGRAARLQRYKALLEQSYDRLGVPVSRRRLLPKAMRARIGEDIRHLGIAAQQARVLTGLKTLFGESWLQAKVELRPHLPPMLLLVADLNEPDQQPLAEMLAHLARQPLSTLTAAVPPAEAEETRSLIDGYLQPLDTAPTILTEAATRLALTAIAAGEPPTSAVPRSLALLIDGMKPAELQEKRPLLQALLDGSKDAESLAGGAGGDLDQAVGGTTRIDVGADDQNASDRHNDPLFPDFDPDDDANFKSKDPRIGQHDDVYGWTEQEELVPLPQKKPSNPYPNRARLPDAVIEQRKKKNRELEDSHWEDEPQNARFDKTDPHFYREEDIYSIELPKPRPPLALGAPGEVDIGYIEGTEGDQQLRAYVPYDPNQSKQQRDNNDSGVTIASGFDLGSKNEYDLRVRYKLPKSLRDKLKPYLGRKKEDAIKYLKANPLLITQEEADLIDRNTWGLEIDSLKKLYSNAIGEAGKGIPWDELPTQLKTVMLDINHQYGQNAVKDRTTSFWRALMAQDWEGTIRGLEKLKEFEKRRKHNAAYLRGAFRAKE